MQNHRTRRAPIAFRKEIERALELADTRPDVLPSTAAAESGICGSLAVWEAVTLGDSESAQWRCLWASACRELHGGAAALTLGDLPGSEPFSWRHDFASPGEIDRAYRRVRRGMGAVYRSTLTRFPLTARSAAALQRAAAVTQELIEGALMAENALHGPAGQEAYLLRLIQWLEHFRSRGRSQTYAWEMWREQVRRVRVYGPASSKTLAVGLPLGTRLKKAEPARRPDHRRALKQLAKRMRAVVAALDKYLQSCIPVVDGVGFLS